MNLKTALPHPPPAGISFHRLFFKDWQKLRYDRFRQKFIETILPLFQKHSFDHNLRNHAIGKQYPECRSIDITGDIRAIYTMKNNAVVFIRIGTHSHLYG